jgi:membrane-anchored protein YejM (alkaline phosphatase superfamily)
VGGLERVGARRGDDAPRAPLRPGCSPRRLSYQRRIESARSLDRNIASLLGGLEKSGELARTLVVFTSDNVHPLPCHGNVLSHCWRSGEEKKEQGQRSKPVSHSGHV